MSDEQQADDQPLFRDIDADHGTEQMTVESLCIRCHENGTTRIMLTKIPHFKEIIIASFSCAHCGYENKDIQSAGAVQDTGCSWTLSVKDQEDLGRQVVKSEVASLRIPELEFEISSMSQPGIFSTVEGLLQRAIDGLQQQQVVRRALDAALADSIDAFIGRLEKAKSGTEQFQLILDDPSGNSCIEFLNPPAPDPKLQRTTFTRTLQQNIDLGLASADTATETPTETGDMSSTAGPAVDDSNAIGEEEILSFSTNCPNCQSPATNHMKPVDIPLFKQVIVMALKCDRCGFSSNEVKSAGGVEPTGMRIQLKISEELDLSRDILVAETATLGIPDIDLEVTSFSSSGKFTTVEGILEGMKSQLNDMYSLSLGDSSERSRAMNLRDILGRIDNVVAGKDFVTLHIDDPAGNSYVQNLMAPDPDPNLSVERYERTAEQNEELGVTALMAAENSDAQ